MITLNELWAILGALAVVFVLFGIARVTHNWVKYPVMAILINTEPFVIYIRLLGITIFKIGKPDYLNNWNTFSFIIHGNSLIAYKWFIYGHQKSDMIFVKAELLNLWIKVVYGKRKATYIRAPGVNAFPIHIKEYSKHSDYFVMGTMITKQRFKRTKVMYGYILIGECSLYSGKCFIEASNQDELRAKMTEAYSTMDHLQKVAGSLTTMVTKANANMVKQTSRGHTIDM